MNGHNEIVATLFELPSRQGYKIVATFSGLPSRPNVNHATKAGQTVLILASREGHKEIVAALLPSPSDVNHANNNGSTALIFALWMCI